MFTTLSMSQPVLIYMYTVMIQSRQNIVRIFQFSGGPFTLPWIRLPILNSVTFSSVSIHCSILNERWVKQKGSKCYRIKTQIEDFVAPAPQAAAVLIKHLVNFLNICESCRLRTTPLYRRQMTLKHVSNHAGSEIPSCGLPKDIHLNFYGYVLCGFVENSYGLVQTCHCQIYFIRSFVIFTQLIERDSDHPNVNCCLSCQ